MARQDGISMHNIELYPKISQENARLINAMLQRVSPETLIHSLMLGYMDENESRNYIDTLLVNFGMDKEKAYDEANVRKDWIGED